MLNLKLLYRARECNSHILGKESQSWNITKQVDRQFDDLICIKDRHPTRPLQTKRIPCSYPRLENTDISQILDEKNPPFLNPNKHPFFKQNIFLLYKIKYPFGEIENNRISIKLTNFFYVRRIFHYF